MSFFASRGTYSGTVKLGGRFTLLIEGGTFYMEDFDIDWVHSISYDEYNDIDLDSSYFDWISDIYDEFIKEAKKALIVQNIQINEDTYAYADFTFEAEGDISGSWDDGDYWTPPDDELLVGEQYFDIDVDFDKIEYIDEDK